MRLFFSALVTLTPLILGIAAWVLSVVHLFFKQHRWMATVSWLLCACALWFPIYSWSQWAQAEDVAALLDCARAYSLCASVLLVGNLLFSLPAWLRFTKK